MSTRDEYFGIPVLYWILLLGVLCSHTVAAVLTWKMLDMRAATECNPVMSYAFVHFGVFFTTVVISLVLIVVLIIMVKILVTLKNRATSSKTLVNFISTGGLIFLNVISAIDAVNDIAVVLHSPIHTVTFNILNSLFILLHLKAAC